MIFTVPVPAIAILPAGPIQGAMVGSPQDIQCIVSTVSGVESSLVMISWMGPKGSCINNSRIIIKDRMEPISPLNTYNSTLQFVYLMEGDEGAYTCRVTILETANVQTIIEIESLTSKQPILYDTIILAPY